MQIGTRRKRKILAERQIVAHNPSKDEETAEDT